MKKLVLNNREIKNLTSKICREISTDPWTPDVIVGINRGGLVPAVMISQWFDVGHVPLTVSLRDHVDCESNLWLAEMAFGSGDTEKKNIMIVDDINDTGATFNWIMNDWKASVYNSDDTVWGSNVKFAVLVDNQSSQCAREMDFCGMEINKAEDDVWVDFPWEDWWTK